MHRSLLLAALIISTLPCAAQFSVQGHLGGSYIEHVATGVTFRWGTKHTVTALYGSNLFINTKDFSNLFIHYDRSFPRWQFAGIVPRLGVKGGNSFYTNRYYKWKVVSLIPFAGLRYPVGKKTELLFEAGPVYSFEQYLRRVGYGEIGHYRYVLLELKVAVAYTLFTRKKS